MIKHTETKRLNSLLLIKLCREVGEAENISKQKALDCSLVLNDALTRMREINK